MDHHRCQGSSNYNHNYEGSSSLVNDYDSTNNINDIHDINDVNDTVTVDRSDNPAVVAGNDGDEFNIDDDYHHRFSSASSGASTADESNYASSSSNSNSYSLTSIASRIGRSIMSFLSSSSSRSQSTNTSGISSATLTSKSADSTFPSQQQRQQIPQVTTTEPINMSQTLNTPGQYPSSLFAPFGVRQMQSPQPDSIQSSPALPPPLFARSMFDSSQSSSSSNPLLLPSNSASAGGGGPSPRPTITVSLLVPASALQSAQAAGADATQLITRAIAERAVEEITARLTNSNSPLQQHQHQQQQQPSNPWSDLGTTEEPTATAAPQALWREISLAGTSSGRLFMRRYVVGGSGNINAGGDASSNSAASDAPPTNNEQQQQQQREPRTRSEVREEQRLRLVRMLGANSPFILPVPPPSSAAPASTTDSTISTASTLQQIFHDATMQRRRYEAARQQRQQAEMNNIDTADMETTRASTIPITPMSVAYVAISSSSSNTTPEQQEQTIRIPGALPPEPTTLNQNQPQFFIPPRPRRREEFIDSLNASLFQVFQSTFQQWAEQMANGMHHLQGQPPASESAIEGLKRVKLPLLKRGELANGEEYRCVVCQDTLDEMEEGQEERKEDVEQPEEDPLQGLAMPCGHVFHADCLKPWLKNSNTCPTCRYEICTDNEEYNAGVTRRMQARVPVNTTVLNDLTAEKIAGKKRARDVGDVGERPADVGEENQSDDHGDDVVKCDCGDEGIQQQEVVEQSSSSVADTVKRVRRGD